MNSKNIVAITNHSICMKCLNKDATHPYHIGRRGYGSVIADCSSTHFQLCDDCHEDKFDVWVNEQPEMIHEYCEDYKHEQDILDFIHSLPLQSQELFHNTFDDDGYNMDAQDWIDYKLDELPHEKCKEYCMYSRQEIQAYQDRFPKCNKIFLKVYNDNSSACYCPYGASGNKDGSCDINISDECYLCTHFEEKDDAFKMATVDERKEFYNRERQRLEEMITYATERLKKLENGELDDEM